MPASISQSSKQASLIDIDEDDTSPTNVLLGLNNPVVFPTPQAVHSLIVELPFLWLGECSQPPLTPHSMSLSPDFSGLRNRLMALSDGSFTLEPNRETTTTPMDWSAILTAVKSLLVCDTEEVFRPKITVLRVPLFVLRPQLVAQLI